MYGIVLQYHGMFIRKIIFLNAGPKQNKLIQNIQHAMYNGETLGMLRIIKTFIIIKATRTKNYKRVHDCRKLQRVRRFFTNPCHKIYRVKQLLFIFPAVLWKLQVCEYVKSVRAVSCKNQYFAAYLKTKSNINMIKVLIKLCDTYNRGYLQNNIFSFYLYIFQLHTDCAF